MKDIKQFLIDHPLISVRAIEQQLSIPLGTIRIKTNRTIPEKFIPSIIELLSSYGLSNDVQTSVIDNKTDVQTSDSPIISKDSRQYITRKNVIGYMNGPLFKRIDLPDNTVVIIPSPA